MYTPFLLNGRTMCIPLVHVVVSPKLASLAHLLLRYPDPQPDDVADDDEDDQGADEDTYDIRCRQAGAVLLDVEERVDVEALRRVGEVGEAEIQRKKEDEDDRV